MMRCGGHYKRREKSEEIRRRGTQGTCPRFLLCLLDMCPRLPDQHIQGMCPRLPHQDIQDICPRLPHQDIQDLCPRLPHQDICLRPPHQDTHTTGTHNTGPHNTGLRLPPPHMCRRRLPHLVTTNSNFLFCFTSWYKTVCSYFVYYISLAMILPRPSEQKLLPKRYFFVCL